MGPNSKKFIYKPFRTTVKGPFVTLTSYTGDNITFDATKTVHGSLSAVLNVINTCNCPVIGGGGGGPFTINGDTGTGSVTSSLTVNTGSLLKTVASGSTVTISFDGAGAAVNSFPNWNGSAAVWSPFTQGKVDDPTVGGVDITNLQTVLDNINSSIVGGGGGTISGTARTIVYYNASNDPVSGNYFKLDSSAAGVVLRVANPLNYHPMIGVSATVNTPNLQTYDPGSFGVGRTFSSGSGGVVIGAADGDPKLSFSHIGGTYASPTNSPAGSIVGSVRGDALVSGATVELPAAMYIRYVGSDIPTNTTSEIGFAVGKASPVATLADAVVIKGNGLYLNGGTGNPAWYLPYTNPGVGTRKLQWVSNVPQWVDDNSGLSEYNVAITGSNTGSFLRIVATNTTVTASYSSNQLTITIPAGVRVVSADWRLVAADVQATSDAAGTTNWVLVRFIGTSGNTDITDIRIPQVQKVAIPATGALSLTNAATADYDNNPAVSAVANGSGNITLRIGGIAAGTQGYHLKFSGI